MSALQKFEATLAKLKGEVVEFTDAGPWTKFYDMHSGGRTKLKPYEMIYIQADESTATKIFELLFDRDPSSITCHCCGDDYSIGEYISFTEASDFYREKWVGNVKVRLSLNDYAREENVLVIPADLIAKTIKFKLIPEALLLGDGNERLSKQEE